MKITTLIFVVTLITGCGSSSEPVNPLAVVSDDDQTPAPVEPVEDTTSQTAPIAEPEQTPALVTEQTTEPTTTEQLEPESVSTPAEPATPVEVEPQPEPVEPVVVEPIQESVPEPAVVYATPDPFFGVPLICGRGSAPAGSRPTEFMRLTINQDGTFATTSIPNRTGVFIGAWSYAQGVIFVGTTDWTIDGDTLRKDEAICVEKVTETQTSVTLESLIGESLDCVIYGEQEGLVPHTLVFQEDGTLFRTYSNGNTQSFSWSEESNTLVTPVGSFSVVDDTLTTGSTNGWEYACTPRTA